MGAFTVKSAVATVALSTGVAGVATSVGRHVFPREHEEAIYRDKTGKDILTGWEIETHLGVTGGVVMLAAGGAALLLGRLGAKTAPLSSPLLRTALIGGGAVSGIAAGHVMVEPVAKLVGQIGPTIEYIRSGGAAE